VKRFFAALFIAAALGAPLVALAQPPAPPRPEVARAAERADQAMGEDEGFADDGTFDDSDWGSEWVEDPFSDEANAEWAAAAEESGGHHEAHFDPNELLAQVVNFILWLVIVILLARKPAAAFLKNRRLAVEEGLVEAKNLKDAAEAKYEEYSERLERLDEELEKLRAEMIAAGENERDQIVAAAEERATRMRKDAQFRIDQQMKQLRADMMREAIDAAIVAAEEVLTKQVRDADQSRLANQYLDSLQESLEQDEVRA